MSPYGESVQFTRAYVDEFRDVVGSLRLEDVAQATDMIQEAFDAHRQVFLAGNGGSAATAEHTANDLMKGVAKGRGSGLRTIALSANASVLTAIANDESYADVFASQLAELAAPGDLLVVFSASGNSPNILRALEAARRKGMTTLAFLGMGGGQAAGLAHHAVVVPSNDYGHIEDAHLMCNHLITAYLSRRAPTAPQAEPTSGRRPR